MSTRKEIEEVFLSILRGKPISGGLGRKIQHFKENDWDVLRRLAIDTGLLPAFYNRLSGLKLNPPPEFLAGLKNLYLVNLRKNIKAERELTGILRLFKESGVPVMPLKGVFLARYIYGDLALRQASCDLDLLIPKDRLPDAEKALNILGYHTDERQKGGHCNFSTQIFFSNGSSGLNADRVDLHWDIRDRFVPTHTQDIWLNAREVGVDGYPALAPSNEDILLCLALAFIFESEPAHIIKYLYDLHNLVAAFAGEIDWAVVSGRARQYNLQTALFFALKLSGEMFHTSIPGYFLDSLNPGFVKKNLLKLWINKTGILRFKKGLGLSFTWHYFVTRYLISRNAGHCIKLIYKKIFKPMDEVMWTCRQPFSKASYYLYIRRLLKPFIRK